MASDKGFVDFILEQLADVAGLSCKKMFGEYAIYCDGKIVALICDNRLLVKPTADGRAFIGEVVEAAPYPGAKPCFLIDDRFEDREWICQLVRMTARELPAPKAKMAKEMVKGPAKGSRKEK